MMSIYRIVEPCGGKVTIDGQDICQIGLFDLRSRLALVPQVGFAASSQLYLGERDWPDWSA